MCGCPQASNIFDDSTSKHFFSLEFYPFIASEAPTGTPKDTETRKSLKRNKCCHAKSVDRTSNEKEM
jgi:hypothetical protein